MRKTLLTLAAFAVLASVAAAADGAIPNRLGKAKVGEWAMLQNVAGDDIGRKTKVSVIEVKDGVVVIKRELFNADGTPDEVIQHEIPLERYNARLADLEGKAKQISRERLTVKDKEFSVVAVSWDGDAGEDGAPAPEFKIWVSADLPIGGIAKIWSSSPDFPAADVVDYGFEQ